VPVRELSPEYRDRLQRVADKEGLANVPPEEPVVDASNVPQDPPKRKPQATVQANSKCNETKGREG
jgi:hypothetical protein